MIACEHIDTIADGVGSRLLPVLSGELTVTAVARGWTGRLLAHRLGLLTTLNTSVPGSLRISCGPDGERWTREFGGHHWHSVLTADGGDEILERAGFIALRFAVELDSHWNTHMSLRSVAVGPVRIPIHRWFHIHGTISPDTTTRVEMRVPGGSCTYVATFDRTNRPTTEADQ